MEITVSPPTSGEQRTSNLGLAAYLNSLGHKETRLELMDGSSVIWVFTSGVAIELACHAYNSGNATVEPKAFLSQVKRTRDKMFTFIRQNK